MSSVSWTNASICKVVIAACHLVILAGQEEPGCPAAIALLLTEVDQERVRAGTELLGAPLVPRDSDRVRPVHVGREGLPGAVAGNPIGVGAGGGGECPTSS